MAIFADNQFLELFGADTLGELELFTAELIKWNKKFSFTAITDKEIFHKLVAPSAWLGLRCGTEEVGVIADFGCGPGIPGLPMAIADKVNEYRLYDSSVKKIGFVNHCVKNLGIFRGARVGGVATRVSGNGEIGKADMLVSRAAGAMVKVVALWQGKISAGGEAMFFKGSDADEEILRLQESYSNVTVEVLETPGLFKGLVVIRVIDAFD